MDGDYRHDPAEEASEIDHRHGECPECDGWGEWDEWVPGPMGDIPMPMSCSCLCHYIPEDPETIELP